MYRTVVAIAYMEIEKGEIQYTIIHVCLMYYREVKGAWIICILYNKLAHKHYRFVMNIALTLKLHDA